LVHVPFKGNAETTTALLGGHIDAVADSTGWAPQVNDGKFRLLVSWGATRTKNWPTVPTLKEVGIDMVSNSPYGLGGPKGMAPEIVKVLHDAFRKGLDDPSEIAPELTGHGLPLSKCEAYNRVYDQFYQSR
jgi:tripartite-type tricarboxylate transporter receptor subunit TctC